MKFIQKIFFLFFIFYFNKNNLIDPFKYNQYDIYLIKTRAQLDAILNIPNKLEIILSYLDNSPIAFKSILEYRKAFQIVNTSLIKIYRIHSLKGITPLFLSKKLPAIFSYYNGQAVLPPIVGYKTSLEIVKYIVDAYYASTGEKMSLKKHRDIYSNIFDSIDELIASRQFK